MTLYTIGHSNRSQEDLLELLRENSIQTLIDVRSYPTSAKWPHFDKWRISNWLKAAGVSYTHLPGLGGRRRTPNSGKNGGWHNESFRSYADYAITDGAFTWDLHTLELQIGTTAIMCAEAVPWSCHRTVISDWLVARGYEVVHILGPGKLKPHVLGKWAAMPHVEGGVVTYPAANVQAALFEGTS